MKYHSSPRNRIPTQPGSLITFLIVLLFSNTAAFATEPEPPIDFWDEEVTRGHVLLIINPSLVSEVNIQQLLHEDGKVLQRNEVDFRRYKVAKAPVRLNPYKLYDAKQKRKQHSTKPLKLKIKYSKKARKELHALLKRKEVKVDQKTPEFKQRFAVAVPVVSLKDKKIPDGYFASKFVANAKWRKGGVAPIHVEQWVYLKSSKGRVKAVSLAEYSRHVDPASKGIGANGKPIRLNIGKDGPEEKHIDDTKKHKAIPLGRLGGEPLEQPEKRAKSVEKKTVDESNER